MNVARETIVTARDQLWTRLDRMFAQLFLEQFALIRPTPDLIRFRHVFRPWRFLPAELNGCIGL